MVRKTPYPINPDETRTTNNIKKVKVTKEKKLSLFERPQIKVKIKAVFEKPTFMISNCVFLSFFSIPFFSKIQNNGIIYSEPPNVPFVEGISFALLISIFIASFKERASPLKQDSII